MSIFVGIISILHGMVHLLYAGQALHFFELRPRLAWPDSSWLFSRLLSDESTRLLAAVLLALTTLGFIVAGVALLFRQEWWHPTVIVSAGFSTVIFFLLWDGKFQALDEKGLVGIFLNVVAIAFVLFLKHNA
jgi:hypothetical protein